jgi:hypothetical protein
MPSNVSQFCHVLPSQRRINTNTTQNPLITDAYIQNPLITDALITLHGQLISTFYDKSCPNAPWIVKAAVKRNENEKEKRASKSKSNENQENVFILYANGGDFSNREKQKLPCF